MVDFVVRKFSIQDRARIREISCATSFLGLPRVGIFTDDEILADSLTLYFTDFEPDSSFVAVSGSNVIGYITGAKDVKLMDKINSKIFPCILLKAFKRGLFFRGVNLKYFYYSLRSLLRGEFSMPDFSRDYPATLHINIDKDYRGQGVGEKLIEEYLSYLKVSQVKGVHFGALSEGPKRFFTRTGFTMLFQGKRTYFRPYSGEDVNFYIFGRKI